MKELIHNDSQRVEYMEKLIREGARFHGYSQGIIEITIPSGLGLTPIGNGASLIEALEDATQNEDNPIKFK